MEKGASDRKHMVRQLHLAAFLVTKGHKLLHLEQSQQPGLVDFIFQYDTSINQDRSDYFDGNKNSLVAAREYSSVMAYLKKQAAEFKFNFKLNGEHCNGTTIRNESRSLGIQA